MSEEFKFMFKVGDKVRCIDPSGFMKKNTVYTIAHIFAEDDLVGLLEDPFQNGAKWSASRFELVEDDPIKQPNEQVGIKFDNGKIDYTYLLKDLPVSVEEVTKVLIYGSRKYSRSNYSKVESERYEAAFLRHAMSYLKGEKLDPETGYHHLAHAVCCLMFLVEREVKKEDE